MRIVGTEKVDECIGGPIASVPLYTLQEYHRSGPPCAEYTSITAPHVVISQCTFVPARWPGAHISEACPANMTDCNLRSSNVGARASISRTQSWLYQTLVDYKATMVYGWRWRHRVGNSNSSISVLRQPDALINGVR